jgi:protein O-GlcNAc transferase
MNTSPSKIISEIIGFVEKNQIANKVDYVLQAIEEDEKNIEVIFQLGISCGENNSLNDALTLFECLQINNKNDERIPYNLGFIQSMLGDINSALKSYDAALLINPNDTDTLVNKGIILNKQKRHHEAIAQYDKALTINPSCTEAWSNKGVTLDEIRCYEEAVTHYDKALSINPSYIEAWSNKGNVLTELKRYEEALSNYDRALRLDSTYIEGWSNRAEALNLMKRHEESAKSYLNALESDPNGDYLLGRAHHQMMLTCNWTDYENITKQIFERILRGEKAAEPFGLQGIANSEEVLKRCAEIYSNDKFPQLGDMPNTKKYEHKKIRIGYLCGEFRTQATTVLMARIWELHDKDRFEIHAFDNGWSDDSDYRHRIEEAFTGIYDISRMSDLDATTLIKSKEIDILVNLNGFFGLARQGIFSHRAAPIQVNYLGFPGTIGADYIDYIIADEIVIPLESRQYYSEKVVYLPNSYQANDDKKKISSRQFTRSELGLPEAGFIFCCFNNAYKITPATFDGWARIMEKVEGSILWLLGNSQIVKDNLIKEALARGITAERVVFSEGLDLPDHLARHDLADLFLDTLPYNAHTTASDALWAGLPVLTLVGDSFAGRVTASLLNAIGLPELITQNQEEYEALAIKLANNAQMLAAIKQKLVKNRLTAPLFNSLQFTQHLEQAYIKIYEYHQAGLPTECITIS